MRYHEIIEAIESDNNLFGTRPVPVRWTPELIADLLERGQKVLVYTTLSGGPNIIDSVSMRRGDWIAHSSSSPDAGYTYNGTLYLDPNKYVLLKTDGAHMLITNSDWKQYRGKKLSENDNDDEMFGSSERTKSFRGWTVQQVKDHFDELNSELYGYEAYWEDDQDPEFVRKENELKAMMQYARIRFGEDFYQYLSNWREYSDRQMARYDDRTKADPFNNTRYYGDPRITKAGKMHKQDQRVRAGNIKDRIGKHTPHELPENDESDDELFGAGGEKMYVVAAPDDEILGTFQNPETAVAFAKKQIASYLEDGWGDLDTIKVYKQRLNDLDHGVPIAEFPITDDPLDESEDDDDLFATPRIRFGDFFNEHDEDELQAMGFSYGDDPEQDVDIINHYLEDGPVNWRVVKLIDAEDGQGDDIILHLDRSSRLG